MTDTGITPSHTTRTGFRLPKPTANQIWVTVALVIYTYFTYHILRENDWVPHFRIDLTPLLETSLAIQIHVAAAVTTFSIGLVLMFAKKGFGFHRTLGWSWVAAMAVTAISSFFISTISPVHFSPIHALSAWTLIALPMGVAAVRRGDVKKHRKEMTSMFVRGMLIAGLFTFLPGRLMFSLFFG